MAEAFLRGDVMGRPPSAPAATEPGRHIVPFSEVARRAASWSCNRSHVLVKEAVVCVLAYTCWGGGEALGIPLCSSDGTALLAHSAQQGCAIAGTYCLRPKCYPAPCQGVVECMHMAVRSPFRARAHSRHALGTGIRLDQRPLAQTSMTGMTYA